MLGQLISNRYKIIEEFARDPLSIIYKAQDQSENKLVFITLLNEKARQRPLETLLRFKREIEQVARLEAPGLLKVYSYGESESGDYIVSEYFDSLSLSRFLTQPQNIGQPLTQDKAVEIILQVAAAMDSAHQSGILHQAIQPQCIYVTADLKTAKLTDFGRNLLIDISRVAEKEDIISTFGYLSPESSGILRKPVDGRSDIYSLGILLYQLTTGRLPYTAGDVSTLIHQHIAKMPDPPSALNDKLSPAINNIILHLISKDPQDRYQSLGG
ncbi:MAG: serine/threonine-protein kinase, partial [Candidatus Omnitrophica bacterium]|nr:serine/threonine-protein kinase [Candidatus Omnitrophota bacterium]